MIYLATIPRADRGEHRGHLISRELREKKEKCGEKLHDIWKGRSPACRPVHTQLVDRFLLPSALVREGGREGGIVGDEHQFRYRRAISGMVWWTIASLKSAHSFG